MTRLLRRLILPAATAAVGLLAAAASGQTFTSSGAITIPVSGPTTPYPSIINVTGVTGPITRLQVVLSGLSHTWPDDIDLLLVAPTGQTVVLMSDAGGSFDLSGVELVFTDGFPSLGSTQIASGIFAPTSLPGSDTFGPPAPAGPYGVALSAFNGISANGTWTLYVVDDVGGFDGGSIASWSLRINDAYTIPPQPATSNVTYQGKLENNGSPVNGTADLRFTFWTNAISTNPADVFAPTIDRLATTVTNGLFTVTLPIDAATANDNDIWVEIAARSPAGSGTYTTLTPRTRLNPAIQAQWARNANNAANAANAANATNASALNSTGRIFIGGGAGAAPNSPGLWLRSPAVTGTDKAFIGLLDDNTVGFFSNTTGWDLTMDTDTGFTGVGLSGVPALAQLDINGTTLIRTSATNALAFGPIGDFAGTAENSDAIFFQRVNTSAPGTNISVLRLALGDDGLAPASVDAFSIGFVAGGTGAYTERIRFQADGSALKPGGGAWAVLSDPRKKHDVAPLSGTLDKILKLRGYSYLYNDDAVASGTALPGTQIGLMADEVARVFPDWVSTNNEGTRFVTERSTTALMVEALRDLRTEKDTQIAKQQQVIDDLTARLARLEAALKASQTGK